MTVRPGVPPLKPHSVVIVLGPPGSGKGTQCRRLSELLRLPHISTGDLLRDHIKRGTALGNEVREIVDKGELVPDKTVVAMLQAQLMEGDCKRGFILDGFPRTREQAELLEETLGSSLRTTSIFRLRVSESSLVARLADRRTCVTCGKTFSTRNPTAESAGICDADGSELVVRNDDSLKTARDRLTLFDRMIPGISEYYSGRCIRVVDVRADSPIEEVTASIVSHLSLVGVMG